MIGWENVVVWEKSARDQSRESGDQSEMWRVIWVNFGNDNGLTIVWMWLLLISDINVW